MSNTEDILKRISAYQSLLRYQYLTTERLSRLEAVNDFYSTIGGESSSENIGVSLRSVEQLSKGFSLPLNVRGILLSEGRHKIKYYSAEELKKAVSLPINQSFNMIYDHRNKEASKIIGRVDKVWYDEKNKCIRFKGHVNDETAARNIDDGAITDVSVGVVSTVRIGLNHGVEGVDLVFDELSCVKKGADSHNFIESDK